MRGLVRLGITTNKFAFYMPPNSCRNTLSLRDIHTSQAAFPFHGFPEIRWKQLATYLSALVGQQGGEGHAAEAVEDMQKVQLKQLAAG